MGVIRRQSFYSSIFLYLGIAIGFILTLFVYPKYLKPEELGIVRTFIDFSTLWAPYLLLGIPNTYVRYFPFFKDNPLENKAFKTLSVLVPLIGTIVFLLLFLWLKPLVVSTFEESGPEFIPFIDLVPALVIVLSGVQLIRAYFRSDLNVSAPNFYESVLLRVLLISSVLIYTFLGYEIEQLIYLVLASHVLILSLMIIHYAVQGNLKFGKLKFENKKLLTELLKYGLFVIANALSGVIIVKIDTWMIGSLNGMTATGIYSVAMQIGILIELPKRSISQITLPVLAKAWKNKNLALVEELYKKTSLVQLVAGGVLFVLIWGSTPDLFEIIPNGNLYKSGIWVVLFIALAKLFAISTGSNIELLQMSDYYRHSLWIRSVLIISAIGFNLWLIPEFGITGAAIATALSFFVNNLLLGVLIYVKLKMQPFSKQHLNVLAFLILLMLTASFINIGYHPLVDIIVRSMVVLTLAFLAILFLPISDDFRDMIKMVLKKLGIKF